LARYYVEKFCRDVNKSPVTIPEDCLQALVEYDWPGNVRELANCLERAVILCDDNELNPSHLGLDPSRDAGSQRGFDLNGTLSEVSRRASASAEKEKIRRVLEETGGDRGRAAEILQVSGKTLLHKMREFGLAETKSSPHERE
jgi:DNA-binding NtrC family response regulator